MNMPGGRVRTLKNSKSANFKFRSIYGCILQIFYETKRKIENK